MEGSIISSPQPHQRYTVPGVVPGCYGTEDYRPHRPILSPGPGVGGGSGQQTHHCWDGSGGGPQQCREGRGWERPWGGERQQQQHQQRLLPRLPIWEQARQTTRAPYTTGATLPRPCPPTDYGRSPSSLPFIPVPVGWGAFQDPGPACAVLPHGHRAASAAVLPPPPLPRADCGLTAAALAPLLILYRDARHPVAPCLVPHTPSRWGICPSSPSMGLPGRYGNMVPIHSARGPAGPGIKPPLALSHSHPHPHAHSHTHPGTHTPRNPASHPVHQNHFIFGTLPHHHHHHHPPVRYHQCTSRLYRRPHAGPPPLGPQGTGAPRAARLREHQLQIPKANQPDQHRGLTTSRGGAPGVRGSEQRADEAGSPQQDEEPLYEDGQQRRRRH
ncbi:hypothetical protein CRUP_025158 [Coryphaenoides rupestris]|nr:hypothetical protein CRUP_025158 [Coryphaenoides rupestris]